MASKADDRINEARQAIERSLRERDKAGTDEVGQAFAAAEQAGERIVGDPETLHPSQLPPQYRQAASTLTFQDLVTWQIPEQTIVKYAQQGLLGQEYMHWSAGDLRERLLMVGRQVQRQAMIDAGRFTGKTVIDPRMEAYWEGREPHPKTGKMCVFLSQIAPLTTAVGINGRIWDFQKGKLYNRIPSEVVRILLEAGAALDRLELFQNFYMGMGQVGVLEKVAQQGGQTNAENWARSYLGPVGGPAMGMPEGERIPGTV